MSRLTIPYLRAGRNAEAEDASRTAIGLLEALPPGRELASAYADQAYARMLNRDNADGVAWGEKAVAAAESLGDDDTLAYGLNMVGTSLVMAGEIERGVPLLQRSLEIARAAGLEVRVVSVLNMLGSGLAEMYELEPAERYLHECVAFGDAHEVTTWYSQSWVALVHAYRARWDEGAMHALNVLSHGADPITRISCLIALGRIRSRRGDPGANEALDEALELALPGGHLQRLGHVYAARAEAAWLRGDSGADDRGGSGGLRPGAREAPPVVRRRARLLAVEGGRARRRAGVDRRAVPAAAGRRRGRRRRGVDRASVPV